MKPDRKFAYPANFKPKKDNYNLDDFTIKAKLGKGAFGNVYLVELKDDDPANDTTSVSTSGRKKVQFAMKVINKQLIFE